MRQIKWALQCPIGTFCPDLCLILVGMVQDALFAKPLWIKTLRKVAGPLADPGGHAAFSAFLEDLDGWYSTEPDRRTVYAHCNGVILANLRAREAREFLDMLAPDYTAAMAAQQTAAKSETLIGHDPNNLENSKPAFSCF